MTTRKKNTMHIDIHPRRCSIHDHDEDGNVDGIVSNDGLGGSLTITGGEPTSHVELRLAVLDADRDLKIADMTVSTTIDRDGNAQCPLPVVMPLTKTCWIEVIGMPETKIRFTIEDGE